MAIVSFGDKDTSEFYLYGTMRRSAGWNSLKSVVLRKLDMILYAVKIDDLKSPPGNELKKLKGSLSEFYSIRINDQWRIIFKWTDAGAQDVRICDYH